MKISVDYNDIFRYVVGMTSKDPIEVQIDFENRYEVFDESIYDYKSKSLISQPETFLIFSKAVSNLRKRSSSMNRQDIIDECLRLSKLDLDISLT